MTVESPKKSNFINLSYFNIIALASPVLIANLAMPLQGAIDLAVVGHFPQSYTLAGLGIASQLWLLILVSFNFLQYASSGLSAQAKGRQSNNKQTSSELANILYRSLGLAIILAVLLWVIKPFIISLGLKLLGAQPASSQDANTYLNIRYYGIVFELMNYALIGWFAGQGKTKQMMLVQVLIALVNIVTTLSFVYILHLGLKGVALGTVIGYAIGCIVAFFIAQITIKKDSRNNINFVNEDINIATTSKRIFRILSTIKDIFAWEKMLSLFSLNKDIFIRTLLLSLSLAWITRLSAQQGDLIMATNALLLQVLSISAFALDGVAVAAESLSGQTIAKGVPGEFKLAIKRTGIVIFWLSLSLSIIWLISLPTFIKFMTDLPEVVNLALEYRYIAAMLPLVGAGAYWLDGVMFGLTAGSKIRQVAIIAAVVFFPLSWLLDNQFGDRYSMAVIWISVYVFLLSRFIVASIVLWRSHYNFFKS